MADISQVLEFSQKFSAAIGALDADAIQAMYSDDATFWHNTTNATQTRAENVKMMGIIFALLSEHSYNEITVLPTPEGYVQHHRVKATFKDGEPVGEAYVCQLVTLENGKIKKFREWMDASQFSKLWERLGDLGLGG